MQHCDGFAAVQLSNPAAARTIALSLCAPCAVTQRQAPVVRLNQAGAFSLPPPHPFRRRGKCRGGFDIAPTNAVRIRRGESGSQKTQHVFWGAPHCLALLPPPVLWMEGDACVAPTKGRVCAWCDSVTHAGKATGRRASRSILRASVPIRTRRQRMVRLSVVHPSRLAR